MSRLFCMSLCGSGSCRQQCVDINWRSFHLMVKRVSGFSSTDLQRCSGGGGGMDELVTMNELCVNRVHFTQASLLSLGSTTEAFIGHSLSTSASNEVTDESLSKVCVIMMLLSEPIWHPAFCTSSPMNTSDSIVGAKRKIGVFLLRLFHWMWAQHSSWASLCLSTGRDKLCPFLSDSSTVEQVQHKQRADLFTFNKVGSSLPQQRDPHQMHLWSQAA